MFVFFSLIFRSVRENFNKWIVALSLQCGIHMSSFFLISKVKGKDTAKVTAKDTVKECRLETEGNPTQSICRGNIFSHVCLSVNMFVIILKPCSNVTFYF